MSTIEITEYLVITVVLFLSAWSYFGVAEKYRILDKPNHRSSHDIPIVRGGGIIFLVGILCWFIGYGMPWPWFIFGITSAAIISFIDDIRSQPAWLRFTIHLLAVVSIFYSLGLFSWPVWLWAAALIVSIGALNAFNFMDGINGITGVYALVSLLTFLYIHYMIIPFTSVSFVVVNILSVVVFLVFNFRKRARCFAGDVGSVTMAFVLIFLLLQLIYTSQNLLWVILFVVYGIDSVVTILFRLKRRENIFQPHRTHLYQYLCNELKWPHRVVSVMYGVVQLLVNSILIYAIVAEKTVLAIGVGILALLFYSVIRAMVLQKVRA